MTFADLAKHFETHYLEEAEYVEGRKLEGVRSLKPAQAAVNAFKQYFGKRRFARDGSKRILLPPASL